MIRYIKKYFYNKRIKQRGQKIIINGEVHIDKIENLFLGKYVFLNNGLKINAMSNVFIGNNVIFGPDVMLWSTDHVYKDYEAIPYGNNITEDGIRIGDNVWIGGRVTILPNIRIDEGAILGMGAVVTKNVPKCAIVGGNPAKIIGYRDINKYEALKKENKLYMRNKWIDEKE